MGVAGRKVSGPFFFAQRPLMPVLCGRARVGRVVSSGLARYLVIHVWVESVFPFLQPSVGTEGNM